MSASSPSEENLGRRVSVRIQSNSVFLNRNQYTLQGIVKFLTVAGAAAVAALAFTAMIRSKSLDEESLEFNALQSVPSAPSSESVYEKVKYALNESWDVISIKPYRTSFLPSMTATNSFEAPLPGPANLPWNISLSFARIDEPFVVTSAASTGSTLWRVAIKPWMSDTSTMRRVNLTMDWCLNSDGSSDVSRRITWYFNTELLAFMEIAYRPDLVVVKWGSTTVFSFIPSDCSAEAVSPVITINSPDDSQNGSPLSASNSYLGWIEFKFYPTIAYTFNSNWTLATKFPASTLDPVSGSGVLYAPLPTSSSWMITLAFRANQQSGALGAFTIEAFSSGTDFRYKWFLTVSSNVIKLIVCGRGLTNLISIPDMNQQSLEQVHELKIALSNGMRGSLEITLDELTVFEHDFRFDGIQCGIPEAISIKSNNPGWMVDDSGQPFWNTGIEVQQLMMFQLDEDEFSASSTLLEGLSLPDVPVFDEDSITPVATYNFHDYWVLTSKEPEDAYDPVISPYTMSLLRLNLIRPSSLNSMVVSVVSRGKPMIVTFPIQDRVLYVTADISRSLLIITTYPGGSYQVSPECPETTRNVPADIPLTPSDSQQTLEILYWAPGRFVRVSYNGDIVSSFFATTCNVSTALLVNGDGDSGTTIPDTDITVIGDSSRLIQVKISEIGE